MSTSLGFETMRLQSNKKPTMNVRCETIGGGHASPSHTDLNRDIPWVELNPCLSHMGEPMQFQAAVLNQSYDLTLITKLEVGCHT